MRQWPRPLGCPRRITAAALIVGAALSFGLGQALGHHAISAGPARHSQASIQRNAASALTVRRACSAPRDGCFERRMAVVNRVWGDSAARSLSVVSLIIEGVRRNFGTSSVGMYTVTMPEGRGLRAAPVVKVEHRRSAH